MPNIGSTELIIVFVVVLLLFGGSKLKELARGMGESTKEVKKISKEIAGEEEKKEKKDNEMEDM